MILLILLALLLTFGFWRWFRFTACNLLYIAVHLGKVRKGRRWLKDLMGQLDDLEAFDLWIEAGFTYKKDGVIDYADWPLVFAMNKWWGDCDAVASLAWAWARRNNLRASYVSIIRPKPLPGHAVCLICVGKSWHMVDSTGVVPFFGWGVHYPNCRIIVRKTR